MREKTLRSKVEEIVIADHCEYCKLATPCNDFRTIKLLSLFQQELEREKKKVFVLVGHFFHFFLENQIDFLPTKETLEKWNEFVKNSLKKGKK